MMSRIRAISSQLTQAVQPVSLALKLVSDDKIDEYLASLPAEAFQVGGGRRGGRGGGLW